MAVGLTDTLSRCHPGQGASTQHNGRVYCWITWSMNLSKLDIQIALTAIRAGYSEKTADEQGSQNLAKLSVANRIAELNSERLERVQIATFT
ncbi:terminase small subunit [Edwardsiella piscicida]|uniref:terminase small subunit n=2 Tax=Edwardsiella piscicida TaxID=1263550 RepID=UPI00300E3DA0